MNTNDFLNEVQRKHGLTSDYQLAGFLGLSRSMVSAYRHNKRSLGDEIIIRVAHALGLSPGYVAACIYAERAESPPVKDMWQDVARRLSKSAAMVLLAGSVCFSVSAIKPSHASTLQPVSSDSHIHGVHIMLNTIWTQPP